MFGDYVQFMLCCVHALKSMVPRQNNLTGTQVHRRLDGTEVCRPSDPGPQSHVGGE